MIKYGAIILVVISLVAGMSYGDVLFGPVVVEKGTPYAGTFGMHCACTAYFVEARNGEGGRLTKECTVVLNGETVLDLQKGWSVASVQVELRETEENEIEIEVKGPGRSAATVEVYERNVTPAPMVSRVYEKKGRKAEEYEESFVLNHWARRFWLKVENGEENGSGRVESGSVEVNGVEVIGEGELHNGVHTVTKEVELVDGMNRVHIAMEGDPGSRIQIGIDGAAQTVTVTKVVEVELPLAPEYGGIQMHDGHVLLRLGDTHSLVEIDEQGNMITRLSPEDLHSGSEEMGVMSLRGGYVWTTAYEEGEPLYRFYDPHWHLLHETRGEVRAIQQISEAGNVLLGWDSQTLQLEPCGGGAMVAVYDQAGTVASLVPMGLPPSDYDIFNQLSPDGLTCWAYCNDDMQVYGTDGILRWRAPWRESRELANGGLAVQATKDSLLFHGSDGSLVRRVVNARPANQEGRGRTTPDGEYALHGGDALMIAKRSGPQSCWTFDPGQDSWVLWMWMSEDGKWVLAVDGTPYPDPQAIWLVGAGGEMLWEASGPASPSPFRSTLTQGGEYFYLMAEGQGHNELCYLYRVMVE